MLPLAAGEFSNFVLLFGRLEREGDGKGRDGIGWDGTVWYGMAWYGMGSIGMDCNGQGGISRRLICFV